MDWLIPSYYFIPLYQNIIRGGTPVRGASKSEPGGRGGKVGAPSRWGGVRKKRSSADIVLWEVGC